MSLATPEGFTALSGIRLEARSDHVDGHDNRSFVGSGNDNSARPFWVSKPKHISLGSKSGPREDSISLGGSGKLDL
jgi:hypothetical protein